MLLVLLIIHGGIIDHVSGKLGGKIPFDKGSEKADHIAK